MNILLLSDTQPGGEWIATQTVIENLKIKDKKFKFYLISSNKNNQLLNRSLFEEVLFIKKKAFKKPLKHYRELLYQIINGAKIIDFLIKRKKIDLVIITDYLLAISYLLSQKKRNYLFFFHGIKNRYQIFRDTLNHYLIFKKILEILAWTLAKKIIVPSEYAKIFLSDSYKFLNKKKFLIIPNLIRKNFKIIVSSSCIDDFKKKIRLKNKEILIYSGRLVEGKGIENLIQSFLKIKNQFPKLILVIAYFGKENKLLIFKDEKIKYFKDLKINELVQLYQSSKLAVLLSYFEISPLFIREAIFCNLPIISTNCGDVSNILSNIFIIKESKIDAITQKIKDFLRNESYYKKEFLKIRNNFIKFNYSEEEIIKSWLKLFKEYEK
jgi:glycosyltransferase involved in cell wall biosynthesis